MIRQIFGNATILEGEKLEPVRGYLVVREGKIQEIGEGSPAARSTDLKRGFILPPFVNAHTHLADSVAKEIYLRKPQADVVGPQGEKFDVLSSKSETEIVDAIRSAHRDMLRTGTLAHCDFREGGLAGVKILQKAEHHALRTIILGRVSSLNEVEDLLMGSDGIGLPSLDALPQPALEDLARRTSEMKKILSIHTAETKDAQESSVKNTGKTEVQRALKLDPSFLVHGTWATKDDFAALKKSGTPLVLCARSNSLLGVGVPPIHLALEVGADFWLGTDNATVCQPNMFRELFFAWACLRRQDDRAGSDEARKLLRAATVEPALELNLQVGPIQTGGDATFLVLARGSNLSNLTDIYSGIVNRARSDNLRVIFARGKPLKEIL
ncbi:MAG: amidohydrolase family protein [Candidatus Hadarchaeota archaeon]|nr:amidohydrolase family protein [Candidatus Hadarchaeota archaeon]